MESLNQYIEALDGYKIKDTHFKIGTKWHSRDFYYAKRLFQNSFYTSRLAFLIAIKIKKLLEKCNDNPQELTIVGYEMYSELVIGLVKHYLDAEIKRINSFIVIDEGKSMRQIPGQERIGGNYIIIVPIASTGSTAEKIDQHLLKKCGADPEKLLQIFNILVAKDSKLAGSSPRPQLTSDILCLKTKWYDPQNCALCFDKKKSQPLLITDKTALIPTLIYDLPKSKTLTDFPSEQKSVAMEDGSEQKSAAMEDGIVGFEFDASRFEGSLQYKSVIRNNEYFIFSNDTDVFIRHNKKDIKEWLDRVKKYLDIQPTQKSVLLSPCHESNVTFINLVNEIVFGSAATIIHYQLSTDYAENFRLLNSNYLKKDVQVYYVDDALISGRSFFNLYDLYRYTVQYNDTAMAGAFILINKASAEISHRVCRAAKHAHFFTAVNIPMLYHVSNANPLEHEIHRYEHLSQVALHDVVKGHYRKEAEELRNFHNPEPSKHEDRHYRMFEATHRVYDFLQKHGNLLDASLEFDQFVEKCGYVSSPSMEEKLSILKVLSQYPFTLYWRLLEKTFQWHKELLNQLVKDIRESLKAENFSFEKFNELKFQMRRAVFLGNLRILEADFFELLADIFNAIEPDNYKARLEKITEELKQKQKERNKLWPMFQEQKHNRISAEIARLKQIQGNLKRFEREAPELSDFHLYLLYQYVETTDKNGWCASRILQALHPSQFKTRQGRRFVRMLENEVAIVMNDFYQLVCEEGGSSWINLYRRETSDTKDTTNRKPLTEPDTQRICDFLRSIPELHSKNKFQMADAVLHICDNGACTPQVLNYLWIKQYLYSDHKGRLAEDSLKYKTDILCQKLASLFPDEKSGVFFIVVDGTKHCNLVYGQNSPIGNYIQTLFEKHESEPGEQKNEIMKFLDGSPDEQYISDKTVVEYHVSDKGWCDMYDSDVFPHLFPEKNTEKWCMMIRIGGETRSCKQPSSQPPATTSADDNGPETRPNAKSSKPVPYLRREPLGILGFYSKEPQPDNRIAKQLILLLRSDIERFIQHHYKHQEFMELRISEATRRFAYLAGHGRQMMQELATENPELFLDIIETMEGLQYLFATKMLPTTNFDTAQTKKNLCQEMLDSFIPTEINLREFHTKIRTLIEAIFKSDIVENPTGIDILDTCFPEQETFHFNRKILEFICFELIINAKKNRFHFPENLNEKNTIQVAYSITDHKALRLEISNSGPKITADQCAKINNGTLKSEEEISGFELIRNVLTHIDPNNTIFISSTQQKTNAPSIPTGVGPVKWFTNTVTICIRPQYAKDENSHN